jgi:hypothetical protein
MINSIVNQIGYTGLGKRHYEDQDDIIDINTPLPLAGALQGVLGK